MITVIAGWIVGWSAIGAWRMVTREAQLAATMAISGRRFPRRSG